MVLTFEEESDLETQKFNNRKEYLEAQNIAAVIRHKERMKELDMQKRIAEIQQHKTERIFTIEEIEAQPNRADL